MSLARSRPANGLASPRLARISLPLLTLLHAVFTPIVKALPLGHIVTAFDGAQSESLSADDAGLWLYLSVAIALVLAGGVFAGLTIAYACYSSTIVLIMYTI